MTGFMADDGLQLAAALAYYSAFSLAPLLLIAVAIAGQFFGEQAVRGAMEGELRQSLGTNGALVVRDMIAQASHPSNNIVMSFTGVVLLLMGAAGLFGQLQAALNKIWKVEAPPRRGIKQLIMDRFLSFSMVLVAGFLLLISMILSAVLQALEKFLGEIAGLPLAMWAAASAILSFAVIAVLLATIFKVLPNAAILWKDVWTGALFTAALFMAGKYAIAWYLGHQAAATSYGAAASFTVVLTWLYYSGIIFLIGAEFTEAHARARPLPGNRNPRPSHARD